MLQTIEGKLVYVVEFDTMPEMPITGLTEDEQKFEPPLGWMTYAQILTKAIEDGIITEPGKYGLYKDSKIKRWEAFKIIE